uniref:BED-type domain-containing protein n=1 Tax=Angiostrongylus cantonensis TaxID=6313 RepID=A0A158PCK2_ANGCA
LPSVLLVTYDPPYMLINRCISNIYASRNDFLQNIQVHEKDGLTSQKIRKCSTKRGRPTKNPVWTFFRRIDDRSVQCNMCARLVKSACATNMSKHLERHHQASAAKLMPDSIDVEFEVNHMTVVDNNYTPSLPSPWNPYVQQHMQPMKHVVVHFFDKILETFSGHYHATQPSQHIAPGVPWNSDRRGTKRNRRTKHPVWELFRRINDGNAHCILCNVVVRSPCSSNFMGHLNRHHSEHYQDIYNRWLEGRVDIPSLPS